MSAAFQLLGGHPVLDLVNTLDYRFDNAKKQELLPSYEDLLRFVRQTHILNAKQTASLQPRAAAAAAGRVLSEVHQLREALALLLYPRDASTNLQPALAFIKRQVLAADAQRELTLAGSDKSTASHKVRWTWVFGVKRIELPLWSLAKSAEALLTSDQFAQVGFCQRDSCRWLFLDASKNLSRRWCDMKICGNRVKAQRFHAKHGH
jgi:predicted RNA-binding Zn ribbon-like protein